jgi:SAM-dependent methyltransferase
MSNRSTDGYNGQEAAGNWAKLTQSFGSLWNELEMHNVLALLELVAEAGIDLQTSSLLDVSTRKAGYSRRDSGGMPILSLLTPARNPYPTQPTPTNNTCAQVGCGEGRYTRYFRGRGIDVCGCDNSLALLANAAAQDPVSPYYHADATAASEAPPLGACSFDVVVSLFVLHMAADEAQLQAMCNFLARQLRPGGALVITTVSGEYVPNPRQTELMAEHFGITSTQSTEPGQVLFTMVASGGKQVNRVVFFNGGDGGRAQPPESRVSVSILPRRHPLPDLSFSDACTLTLQPICQAGGQLPVPYIPLLSLPGGCRV